MKKLIILPQNDTITICLPEDWVGRPLECTLRHPDEKTAYPTDIEMVSEVREETILYQAEKYKEMKKRKRRNPKSKRLRKRCRI